MSSHPLEQPAMTRGWATIRRNPLAMSGVVLIVVFTVFRDFCAVDRAAGSGLDRSAGAARRAFAGALVRHR